MKMQVLVIISVLGLLSFGGSASASDSLIVSGQIIKPTGDALEQSGVNFTVSVKDPSGTCTLWSENFNSVDMTSSGGNFGLSLGTGLRTDGGSWTIADIFSNVAIFSGGACGTYSPIAGDDRQILITFDAGTGVQTLSSQSIKPVPKAMSIGDYGPKNLAKISGAGSANVLNSTKFDFLFNLSAPASASSTPCTTNDVLKYNGSAWICSPMSAGGTVTSITAGSGLTGGAITSSGTIAVNSGLGVGQIPSVDAASAISANSIVVANSGGTALKGALCTTGLILKSTGSAWTCAADDTGSALDSSYSVKGVVQFSTDAATSGISVSAGVASVNSGTSANQIVKLDGSAKLPAVDGSALTAVNASKISGYVANITAPASGEVLKYTGSTWVNQPDTDTLGGLVCSGGSVPNYNGATWACLGQTNSNTNLTLVARDNLGSFSANAGTFNALKLFDGTSGVVTLTTPTSVSSYQLKLPTGTGSAGQALTTDGSNPANLNWTTLPSTSNLFAQGGNTFGSTANLGTTDANDLNLLTSGTTRATLKATTGRLGLGTLTPAENLVVHSTGTLGTSISVSTPGASSSQQAMINLFSSTNTSGTQAAATGSAKGWQLYANGATYGGGAPNDFGISYFNFGAWTEALHISTSGNVGFGTLTPSSPVDAVSGVAAGHAINATASGASGIAVYALNSSTSGSGYGIFGQTNTTGTGAGVAGYQIGTGNTGFGIYAYNTSSSGWGVFSGGSSPNYFSGNVGIGIMNPIYRLEVSGDENITSGFLRFNGTQVCSVSGCTSSSDRRLKENIFPLSDSLAKILTLQGVEYDYIDKAKFGDKHQIGVIAQEVEKQFPEVVNTDAKTGLKSVAYDHLVAPLIEAIKSLYHQISQLEKQQLEQKRQLASMSRSDDLEQLRAENQLKDQKIKDLEERLEKIEKNLKSR